MAQYIDKSALVAEIERRKAYYENLQMIKPVYDNIIEDYDELEDFIDTLEVKEIGLDLGKPDGYIGVETVYKDGEIISQREVKGL